MFRRIVTVTIFVLIMTTTIASANVRITEIAWMGTAESQFGEWFELFNDSSDEVNLAGWKLYEDDGAQLVFTLTKSIPAGGYLLVERTTASSPDPVPGINDESGPFSGSGFSNAGEDLVLKDAQGSSIQTLSFLSGWPAGEAETKKTMQWDGTKWITGVATPKAGATGGDEEEEPPSETPNEGVAYVAPKFEPKIELLIPKPIYATIAGEYDAKTFLDFGEVYNGVFLWNMGDGTIYKSNTPKVVKHSYKYPGTYTISFAYYRSVYDRKAVLSKSVERTVIDPKIIFNVVINEGFQFTNTDSVPIDLSGWVIVLPDKVIDLPPFTIVGSKQTIIMPLSVFDLGSSDYTKATLETPERTKVVVEIVKGEAVTAPASAPLTQRQRFFEDTTASAQSVFETSLPIEKVEETQKPNIKILIFAGVLVLVVGLFVVLERFKVKQE